MGPAIKNEVNGTETDENIIVNTCNSWTDKQSSDGGSSMKKSWVFWNKYAFCFIHISCGYKLKIANTVLLQYYTTHECKDFNSATYRL